MILTKGRQTIELTDAVQIAAYRKCGWTEQYKTETKKDKK